MTSREQGDRGAMTQAARDWIMRLASGDITEQELADLAHWREAPDCEAVFQHELALWRSLDAVGDHLAPQVPASDPVAAKVGQRFQRRYAIAGIAASLALMAAVPEALLRLKSDHRTGATVEMVSLPDGSRAMLDAGSAIAVDYDPGGRRIELLKGRAWFNVVHDNARPFRVAANGGIVEDVGTAFTVSAGGENSEAAVTSGIVQVRSDRGDGRWMRLTVGQRASWTDGAAPMRRAALPIGRIAAWRGGDVVLTQAPVRDAIQEIARYRSGPTFIFGQVDGLAPVTAILRAARADEGLDALAASASLQITRLPGGIAIVRPAR